MKRIISICITAIMLLCSLLPTVYGEEALLNGNGERCIIYVAANGNDSNEGTIDQPLKTLYGARDKIRSLKKQGIDAPKGYVVYVREGNYSFDKSLELTEEDSGTAAAPIVYRSYPGETATLIGGVKIDGKDFTKVSDKAITDRIITSSARDKIYMYDLKKLGINDVGPIYLKGTYSYKTITEKGTLGTRADNPKAPAMELLVNGEAYHVAQYPNGNQTITIDTLVEEGFNWYDDLNSNKGWGNSFIIKVSDDRLKYWTHLDPQSIIMYGKWYFDWADMSIPMKSFDPTTGEIVSLSSSTHGVQAGRGFYVYNLLEELDERGEYYIDPDTCILYCYEPANLSSADIMLTMLDEPIIDINKGSHIQFKYLEISGARACAIDVDDSSDNIEISNCELSFTDRASVILRGKYNGIRDSVIHDINTGINVYGGFPASLTRGECYVTNCEIYNIGRTLRTYAPAISLGGFGNYVNHNKIHNAPHQAIGFGGFDWTIAYNEIYDAVTEADDMAAIYGGISLSQRGGQIKYNYIHDIRTSSPAYSHGIYVDDLGSDMVIMGNVIENTKNALMFNGSRDIYITNNILINNGGGLRLENRVNTNLNRHYDNLDGQPYTKTELFRNHYPKFAEMMTADNKVKDKSYLTPEGNIYKNNVLVNTPLAEYLNGANGFVDDSENYLTSKDPGFYDYENENYMLKQDSVVYTELPEFKALPFTRMGKLDELADIRVQDVICLAIDNPNSLVQGKSTPIDPENANVVPKIIHERTFVPLRFISEALGLQVTFNEETGEITIAGGDVLLSLYAGNSQAKKNGEAITMENAPIIDEGRTLVPLREISNLFGKQVFWHDVGFIVISDDETIFDAEDSTEETMIHYLYNKIDIY